MATGAGNNLWTLMEVAVDRLAAAVKGAMHWATAMNDGLRRLLFPPRCVACHTDLAHSATQMLCEVCTETIAPQNWQGCRRCGAFFAESAGDSCCALCRGQRLHFDTVVPLGRYEGQLRNLVLRMKSLGNQVYATALGKLLTTRRHTELLALEADMVVPVPMHWRRRLWRGLNNSESVARLLARQLGVPVQERLVRRHRHTLPQAGLRGLQRLHNVRGAFSWRGKRSLAGARIIIVDDILTTGATCSEVAKVLKSHGASFAAAVVVARADGRNPT
jgi:ComF family protein